MSTSAQYCTWLPMESYNGQPRRPGAAAASDCRPWSAHFISFFSCQPVKLVGAARPRAIPCATDSRFNGGLLGCCHSCIRRSTCRAAQLCTNVGVCSLAAQGSSSCELLQAPGPAPITMRSVRCSAVTWVGALQAGNGRQCEDEGGIRAFRVRKGAWLVVSFVLQDRGTVQ